MAATMAVIEINGSSYTPGSGGTNKAAGTIFFRANDSSSTDSANPVVRPAASTQQSYEKCLRLRASGTFTSISNPRLYFTGVSMATGCTVYARTTNPSSFSAPAVPSSNSGGTDITGITSSSPKSLAVNNSSPVTAAGDVGDLHVMWLAVGSTASAGAIGTGTPVWTWDEV